MEKYNSFGDFKLLNKYAEGWYNKLSSYLGKRIGIFESDSNTLNYIYSNLGGKESPKNSLLNGVTHYQTGQLPTIYIRNDLSAIEKFRTLLHEYGHVKFGSSDTDPKAHAYYHRKSISLAGQLLGRTAEKALLLYEKYLANRGDKLAEKALNFAPA